MPLLVDFWDEDAVCFDLEEQGEALVKYIEGRLDEAWTYAASK